MSSGVRWRVRCCVGVVCDGVGWVGFKGIYKCNCLGTLSLFNCQLTQLKSTTPMMMTTYKEIIFIKTVDVNLRIKK